MVVGSPPPHRTGTRTGIEQKKRRKIEGNFNDRVLTGTCLRVCVFRTQEKEGGSPTCRWFLSPPPPPNLFLYRADGAPRLNESFPPTARPMIRADGENDLAGRAILHCHHHISYHGHHASGRHRSYRRRLLFGFLTDDAVHAKLSTREIVHQPVFTLDHQPDRSFPPVFLCCGFPVDRHRARRRRGCRRYRRSRTQSRPTIMGRTKTSER